VWAYYALRAMDKSVNSFSADRRGAAGALLSISPSCFVIEAQLRCFDAGCELQLGDLIRSNDDLLGFWGARRAGAAEANGGGGSRAE
jgi:hypothetical protein